MKTSKPLLTLRMLFPAAASLIVLLLGEWIARGSLTADTFISFVFPHFEAYLLAWLLLFLVWELLDWALRIPPLATLGVAVLGCAPCAVNFYTMQLRGEPFLPWDLMQVSEAAGVASAAGLKLQTSMVVSIVLVLVLTVASFFILPWADAPALAAKACGCRCFGSGAVPTGVWRLLTARRHAGFGHYAGCVDAGPLLPLLWCTYRFYDQPHQSGDRQA